MVQVGDAVGASEQQEDRELGGARTVVGRTPNEIIWRRFRTDRVAFVGFIIIVAQADAEPVLAALLNAGEDAFICGQLVKA